MGGGAFNRVGKTSEVPHSFPGHAGRWHHPLRFRPSGMLTMAQGWPMHPGATDTSGGDKGAGSLGGGLPWPPYPACCPCQAGELEQAEAKEGGEGEGVAPAFRNRSRA